MNERNQTIYMQVRLVQLAANKWKISISKVLEVFQRFNIFHYIADNFGLFHMWGDEAVFQDVSEYISNVGGSTWLQKYLMA